jgi:hypothetical protein
VGKTQVHTILKDSEDIYKRWRGGNASQIKKKLKSDSSKSYPNQFATAIMTSTGALIAVLKARKVEKVSQGCPFNRTG